MAYWLCELTAKLWTKRNSRTYSAGRRHFVIQLFCVVYHYFVQAAQSAMFSKFVQTEKHKNSAWQLQKRLHEARTAIDDQLRQHYADPQALQLVRLTAWL